MRRVVCVLLLLSGLLAGLAEGYSLKYKEVHPPVILDGWGHQVINYQDTKSSSSSEEDDTSFIASEETQEGELWASNEDPDWMPSESQESDEDDVSFIADEDTDEGELWASDDDPDWVPSGSDEDDSQYEDSQEYYSQEQDDSQESISQELDFPQIDQSQQDNSGQGDINPFPEILVSGDDDVNAGYWSSSSQQSGQQYQPIKYKRNVKSGYQTGQVIQVPSRYENDPYGPGVSTGVEPLLPEEEPWWKEVGEGVEPVEDDEGGSFGDWFRHGWRTFTGAVEDTVGLVGDTVGDVFDKIEDTFENLTEKLAYVISRFKRILRKFGLIVQEGVLYAIRRVEHSYDQLKQSDVLEKLELELEKGNAAVVKFFEVLGGKIHTWRVTHVSENIDYGLIDIASPVTGWGQLEAGQYGQETLQQMPNFYQDPEVLIQLNQLSDDGVLTQQDVILLIQENNSQNEENQQQEGQQNPQGIPALE